MLAKEKQGKAKPRTAIASRSHFYMLLMMMIECEKRYFKLCTCSGVNGVSDDDEDGGGAVFFTNVFIQNSTLNCGANAFCFRTFSFGLHALLTNFFTFSLTSCALPTETHASFYNGTEVCTENQSRCFSFSHCLLWIFSFVGWMVGLLVFAWRKDWVRARNSRSGCIYFEFENNIFTMSSLSLSLSHSVCVCVLG